MNVAEWCDESKTRKKFLIYFFFWGTNKTIQNKFKKWSHPKTSRHSESDDLHSTKNIWQRVRLSLTAFTPSPRGSVELFNIFFVFFILLVHPPNELWIGRLIANCDLLAKYIKYTSNERECFKYSLALYKVVSICYMCVYYDQVWAIPFLFRF